MITFINNKTNSQTFGVYKSYNFIKKNYESQKNFDNKKNIEHYLMLNKYFP